MIFRPARYALNLAWITVLWALGLTAIEIVFGIDLTAGVTGMVPSMVAAMLEGKRYAKRTSSRPANGEIWKASVGMAAVTLLVSAVFIGLWLAVDPVSLDALSKVEMSTLLATVLAVVVAVSVLLIQLGYRIGVRDELRRIERVAE